MVFGTWTSGWLQQMVGKGALRELSPWQHNRGHNVAIDSPFSCADLTCKIGATNFVQIIVDKVHLYVI